MRRNNIATCLLGLVASGIAIVAWVVGFALHVLPNSEQFYLLTEMPNEFASLFLAIALISYWVVPLTAFIGSIINGFNSETGGIFMFMSALFGCVLPVAYFLVKAYVVGVVLIIPVVLFCGLGLWSVLTKPRVEPGKVVTVTKKRNRFVMGIGTVASVVGTILSAYYAYKLALGHVVFVNAEISTIVLLLSFLVTFGTVVGFLGSFIAGFTSVAGGIFLLLASICCLAYPVTYVVFGGFSVDLICSICLVVVFWVLGIWAVCTKQKTKTFTGPALPNVSPEPQNVNIQQPQMPNGGQYQQQYQNLYQTMYNTSPNYQQNITPQPAAQNFQKPANSQLERKFQNMQDIINSYQHQQSQPVQPQPENVEMPKTQSMPRPQPTTKPPKQPKPPVNPNQNSGQTHLPPKPNQSN